MMNYGRVLACLILLAACTPDYSPDTYASSGVQQANKMEQGVVAGRRQVGVSAQGTAGAVTGAATGGIAGAQMPGSRAHCIERATAALMPARSAALGVV